MGPADPRTSRRSPSRPPTSCGTSRRVAATTRRSAPSARRQPTTTRSLESSIEISSGELPTSEYDPEPLPGEDGGPTDAAPPESDIDVAFGSKIWVRVTRLRADLPLRHLSTDLELEADDDQLLIPTTHRLTRQVGAEKLCAFGVASVTLASSSSALGGPGGTAPVEQTGTASQAGSDCAIADGPSRATLPMVFFAALGLCALARKRRVRGHRPARR